MTAPDDFPEPRRTPALDDPSFTDDLLARLRARAAGTAIEPDGSPPDAGTAPQPPPPPQADPPRQPEPGQHVPQAPQADRPTQAWLPPPAAPNALRPDAAPPAPPSVPDTEPDEDGESPEDKHKKRTRSIIEWIAVAVGALVVAFLIRAFLLQAFYIPSESMEPTLYKNDRILVNKLSYKLHAVHRGDLVVFEKPPGETNAGVNDLIKRVIALPNETIEQRGNQIYVDDKLLSEPYLRDGQAEGVAISWVDGCANPPSERTKCTIPAGHVWVMGDNRDHSHDSRFFGPITESSIVGRAFVKVWPLNKIGFL